MSWDSVHNLVVWWVKCSQFGCLIGSLLSIWLPLSLLVSYVWLSSLSLLILTIDRLHFSLSILLFDCTSSYLFSWLIALLHINSYVLMLLFLVRFLFDLVLLFIWFLSLAGWWWWFLLLSLYDDNSLWLLLFVDSTISWFGLFFGLICNKLKLSKLQL